MTAKATSHSAGWTIAAPKAHPWADAFAPRKLTITPPPNPPKFFAHPDERTPLFQAHTPRVFTDLTK